MSEATSTDASETVVFDFAIEATDQHAFAALSGDRNPLHLDASFALARGLSGSVVYGGLIVAKISQVIGMTLPGPAGIWAALKIDFREPLYVGEKARLAASVSHRSEATRTLSVAIKVTCGERTIATATALAKLFDAKADAPL
jgi:acyl dehydratase